MRGRLEMAEVWEGRNANLMKIPQKALGDLKRWGAATARTFAPAVKTHVNSSMGY